MRILTSLPIALLAVGTACSPSDADPSASIAAPALVQAAPQTMFIATPDPTILGGSVRFGVWGATPGSTVYLAGGTTASGPPACPPSLGGACFDMPGPVYNIGTGVANASGFAFITVNIPAGLPDGTQAFVQAITFPGGAKVSNVTNVTFQSPWAGAGSLVRIPELRLGISGAALGDLLAVQDLVVTAVGNNGFAAQDPNVPSLGGVYVFTGGPPAVTQGDLVDVVGEYAQYSSTGSTNAPAETLLELIATTSVVDASVSVVGTGSVSPIAVNVSSAATRAESLESMLVTLSGSPLVVETDGTMSFGEFTVSDNGGTTYTTIDNEFHSLTSLPGFGVGATFDSVTGVLHYSFGAHKVAPRGDADGLNYVPAFIDTDVPDTDTDVVETDTDPVSTWPGPDTLSPADLTLTEFFPNPGFCSDTNGEFIELLYTGAGTATLLNLGMNDSANTAVNLNDVVVNTGDRVVFAQDAVGFELCYGFAPAGEFGWGLNNGGDTITIGYDIGGPAQIIFDFLDYNGWTVTSGIAYELSDVDGTTWCEADNAWTPPNADLTSPAQANGDCVIDTDIVIDTDPTDIPVDTDPPATVANLYLSEVSDYATASFRFVEIYNADSVAVDLADYTLQRYSNGTLTPSNIALSGTLAAGGTFVVASSSSDALSWTTEFGVVPDLFNGSISANGDDVYALAFQGTVIDSHGVIGEQPAAGTSWNFVDQTVTRDCVATGTTTFDINEWNYAAVANPKVGPCP